MKKTVSYDKYLNEKLKNKEFAAAYLTEGLIDVDDEPQLLLTAIRRVVSAQGIGMAKLAKETGLNRENLYRMLSDKGNPEFSSILKIAKVLGFEIGFRPSGTLVLEIAKENKQEQVIRHVHEHKHTVTVYGTSGNELIEEIMSEDDGNFEPSRLLTRVEPEGVLH